MLSNLRPAFAAREAPASGRLRVDSVWPAGGAARLWHWCDEGVREAQRFARWASRRQPLPILAPALLAAVLALALPVAAPDDGRTRRDADVFADGAATALASEDLAAFRRSKRWGISLREARENEAARLQEEELAQPAGAADASQAAWSPELQAIGFVGVVIAAAERVVLLALPGGSVERFRVGDQLEDGRRLGAISAQALVLQHEDGEQQTLPLFPPAQGASSANAESPPTEGE